MTCTEDFGKFTANIEHCDILGSRSREVELTITWVSCGVYQIEYRRPRDAEDHEVIVAEDWYPPDIFISFTPEQFEKVAELYPSAPKNKRDECYKPFYENYHLDNGMFDFEHDDLFQAYKDPHDDVEKVYLVKRYFVSGTPIPETAVLGLYIADFNRLKDFLDSKKDLIFYSGCQIAMPSKMITDLRNAIGG